MDRILRLYSNLTLCNWDKAAALREVRKIVADTNQLLQDVHSNGDELNKFSEELLRVIRLGTAIHSEIGSICAQLLFRILKGRNPEDCIEDFSRVLILINQEDIPLQCNTLDVFDSQPLGVEHIYLLTGLLQSNCATVLLQSEFYLDVLPMVLKLCCELRERQFWSFCLLLDWAKFVQENVAADIALVPYLECVLEVVNANWENSHDGVCDVNQKVYLVCLALLISSQIESDTGNMSLREFPVEQLHKLCNTNQPSGAEAIYLPWTLKWKYKPLTCILKTIGISEFLHHCPSICEYLKETLVDNTLASAGSDLYKELIVSLRDLTINPDSVDNELDIWARVFRTPLMDSICSPDSIKRQNAINNWLLITVKLFPKSLPLIGQEFEIRREKLLDNIYRLMVDAQVHLHQLSCYMIARCSLMRMCKEQCLLTDKEVADWLLEIESIGLTSYDEVVRVQSFAFICRDPKSTTPFTGQELELMKSYMAYNLNIDNMSFRSHLFGDVRTVLTRVRGFCLANLKRSTEVQATFLLQVDFVDWLWQLALDNLLHSSRYQRRQTCLNIVAAILQTFALPSNSQKRKGGVPANTSTLLSHLQDNLQKWAFFDDRSVRTLTLCAMDIMPDIRCLAVDLLQTFLTNKPAFGDPFKKLLRSMAMVLCTRPKTSECEGAASLFSLLAPSDPDNMAEILLRLLVEQFAIFKTDVLKAAQSAPMFGLILSLRTCLANQKLVFLSKAKCLLTFLSLCREIVAAVMAVLSGEADSPSFEDMNKAIEAIVKKSSTAQDGDDAAISLENQLILSCCWLSLKECCLAFGHVVNTLDDDLISETVEEEIVCCSDILLTVMTKCRHRGVIESGQVGVALFCHSLLPSGRVRLQQLPLSMMRIVLCNITPAFIASTTSATRRSAGLALAMQAILKGEAALEQRPLLLEAVECLMKTANDRTRVNRVESTSDCDQSNAMHTLQAIMTDAELAKPTAKYIVPLAKTCADNFSSDTWSVRNASLQLFGALALRMLGQKKSHDDSLFRPTITCLELFQKHDGLYEVITDALLLTRLKERVGNTRVYHDYIPLLSLLSRTAPTDVKIDSMRKLVGELELLLGHRVYHVRCLAARSVLAVLNFNQVILFLNHYLSRAKAYSANAVHSLLFLSELVLQQRKTFANCENDFAILKLLGLIKDLLIPVSRNVLYCKPSFISVLCHFDDEFKDVAVPEHAIKLLWFNDVRKEEDFIDKLKRDNIEHGRSEEIDLNWSDYHHRADRFLPSIIPLGCAEASEENKIEFSRNLRLLKSLGSQRPLLFGCAVKLMQDESSLVRHEASITFMAYKVSPISQLSSMRHPNLSVEDILVCTEKLVETEWGQFGFYFEEGIWLRVHDVRDVDMGLLQAMLSANSMVLFEHEALNMFEEKVVMLHRGKKVILECLSEIRGNFTTCSDCIETVQGNGMSCVLFLVKLSELGAMMLLLKTEFVFLLNKVLCQMEIMKFILESVLPGHYNFSMDIEQLDKLIPKFKNALIGHKIVSYI